ncbi:Rieske (2Fe-2S) protein [Halobacterium sp. MBLA0001]|uniref:Rieske (2Fe-2S) protein n=1 Tax=Halobacterium sp. MBLA0001 TaxID=3413511 RepID=UPI003C733AF8
MSTNRYRIDQTSELSEHGSRVVREVNGITVAVLNVEGEYHAISNRCPHVGGPLQKGALTGYADVTDEQDTEKIVECPWHCWRFDVTCGGNIDDSEYKLSTYNVEEQDGELFVVL